MRRSILHSWRTLMLTALTVMMATGCANVSLTRVSLIQRGTLAKPEMQFDADPAHVKVFDQVYVAREAAAGGRVTGGGGCGCTM